MYDYSCYLTTTKAYTRIKFREKIWNGEKVLNLLHFSEFFFSFEWSLFYLKPPSFLQMLLGPEHTFQYQGTWFWIGPRYPWVFWGGGVNWAVFRMRLEKPWPYFSVGMAQSRSLTVQRLWTPRKGPTFASFHQIHVVVTCTSPCEWDISKPDVRQLTIKIKLHVNKIMSRVACWHDYRAYWHNLSWHFSER